MTAAVDHLTYNRLQVAASLRRLSDAALIAAEVYSDPSAAVDENDALKVVKGRQQSVEHGLLILEATRAGIRKASRERVA